MSFKFPNGSQGYVEVQAVWRTVPYLLSSPLWHHVCVNYWHDINIPRSLWLVFLLSKKRWKTWSYSTISPNVCFFLSQGAFTAFTLAQVIKIQWPHRQEVNFNIRVLFESFLDDVNSLMELLFYLLQITCTLFEHMQGASVMHLLLRPRVPILYF